MLVGDCNQNCNHRAPIGEKRGGSRDSSGFEEVVAHSVADWFVFCKDLELDVWGLDGSGTVGTQLRVPVGTLRLLFG